MDSKFKVGDVLKFEDGWRAIVASVYPQITNSNEYLYYLWTCYKGAINWNSWSESELIDKVKVIDHMDISSVVGGKESNERDDVEEKKELDKINSALSTLIGYDDLVLRVKVGSDQVKRVKIGEDTIEFETVDKSIRELQKENEGLKEEIDILKSKVEASNLRHMLAARENENADLKNENAFLTHKLRDVEAQRDKVINERDDAEEKNGKLMQKISCAEKQLDEAAKRVYEAREHLSAVLYNK